jgi:hypothetical protein
MNQEIIYILAAIGLALCAGILVGIGFIAVTSIFYSLHYGVC